MSGEPGSPHARPAGVKTPAPPTLQERVARHLEGWRPAVAVVAVALLSAWLVVPAPVEPRGVPLPAIDRARQARVAAERHALALRARSTPLPFEVRAVGESLRRAGRAAATEDRKAFGTLTRELRERVTEARRQHGEGPLLSLRAVQAELFADAVRGEPGSGTDDAIELGGEFVREHLNGDASPEPAVDLAGAFVVRWTMLAGLTRDPAFAPTLHDWRALHRLRLRHPRGEGRARLEDQLDAARSLGRLDPDYPAALAEGMLALQLGAARDGITSLRAFLAARRGGPFELRARNYLAAALAVAPPPPPEAEPAL